MTYISVCMCMYMCMFVCGYIHIYVCIYIDEKVPVQQVWIVTGVRPGEEKNNQN